MEPNDPARFDAFADSHPVGTVVTGVVEDVREFGVFCRLADGVCGLLLVVDFADAPKRFTFPDDYPRVGETVTAKIYFVNREQRILKLTASSRHEWSHDGESILSPKNLAAVERHLEEIGAIVVEHWHYYGGSAPTHLAFDYFDAFKAYLDSRLKPGDAIDVWPFPTDIGTAIARAKYADAEGRVPLGGSY